jgi:CheY-like chemotaxis protein
METNPTNSTPSAQPLIRLLVIDDDETFRNTIKELLEPLGFTVSALGNPVKALEMFTRDKNSFDLVLLDYYMPQLDGAKTYEWIRKLAPNAKVIICSGADELRLRQLRIQYQLDSYIRKPFRTQELVKLIHQVLGRPAPATAV